MKKYEHSKAKLSNNTNKKINEITAKTVFEGYGFFNFFFAAFGSRTEEKNDSNVITSDEILKEKWLICRQKARTKRAKKKTHKLGLYIYILEWKSESEKKAKDLSEVK